MQIFLLTVFICISQLKEHKGKDGTEKPCLSPKSQTAQKKMKPPDTAGAEIDILLPLQKYCMSVVKLPFSVAC